MTMSDGALDLSISSYEAPSQRAPRPPDNGSSDSGRASTDSTSSEVHDDVKVRGSRSSHQVPPPPTSLRMSLGNSAGNLTSGPVFPPLTKFRGMSEMPVCNQRPLGSSISSARPPNSTFVDSSSNPSSPISSGTIHEEEDTKPFIGDRIPDHRVTPIAPFKMYPVDPFNVYSPYMAGAAGGLSPTPVGIQSLYDTTSPSSFPNFPLTPLTSHLLQRKRRADNRDNNSLSASSTSTISSVVNSSSSGSSPGHAVSSNTPGGIGSSRVSTSSPLSPKEDSNGSEGEQRMKGSSMLDVKKDEAYWDRRRKNNEAAKRSRDARRQKEEEIAMRAAFLEQENLKLRAQVAILKNETAKLHYMLYNRM